MLLHFPALPIDLTEVFCPLLFQQVNPLRKSSLSLHFIFAFNTNLIADGVLLRECLSNPDLEGYSVIILDEAHERSLQTDILMGLLRQLQDKKPLLKLVIMSATLQVDLFFQYFKGPQLVSIPGRQYAVEVLYATQPEPDYVDAAMLTCLQLHSDEVGYKLLWLNEQLD